jgi:hypothetical protein
MLEKSNQGKIKTKVKINKQVNMNKIIEQNFLENTKISKWNGNTHATKIYFTRLHHEQHQSLGKVRRF